MNELKWWPQNPYPKSVFPMPEEEYPKIVPNGKTRTALSGCLGRQFYGMATAACLEAIQKQIDDLEIDLGLLRTKAQDAIKTGRGMGISPQDCLRIINLLESIVTGKEPSQ